NQLQVLSGSTTWLSTLIHKKFINSFNECWVPDFSGAENLSGELGHVNSVKIPLKYMGPLSRFSKTNTKIVNKLLVLLSGPEPQRGLLEEKLMFEIKNYTEKVVFIKGILEKEQTVNVIGN